jgi:hypothetical protein
MIKYYVKKPIPIQALQWTGDNIKEMFEFTKDIYIVTPVNSKDSIPDLYVKTKEGEMHANVGDYIIKGVFGEFYPCAQNIFKDTYREYNPVGG